MVTVAPTMPVSMECANTYTTLQSLDARAPLFPTFAREAMLATLWHAKIPILVPSVLDSLEFSVTMETTAQPMHACGMEEHLITSTAPTPSTPLCLAALLFLEVSLVDRLQEL